MPRCGRSTYPRIILPKVQGSRFNSHLLALEIASNVRSALGQIEDVLGELEARAGVINGE